MVTLGNSHLQVEVDETCGCDVVAVRASSFSSNVLDKRGWQCWLKTGEEKDFSVGSLSNFYPGSRTARYTLVEREAISLTAFWETPDGRLRLEKKLRLHESHLTITVTVHCLERSSEPLQLEHYIQCSGGCMEERSSHRTRLIGKSYDYELSLEEFAQRYVVGLPFENTRISISGEAGSLELTASPNTASATAIVFAKQQARGYVSELFFLQPGESFTHQVQLTLLESSDSSNANASERQASRSEREDGAAEIRRIGAAAGERRRVFEALAGEPAFKERWSHLCLQYDHVDLAQLRKVIAEMLVPLRYTGVIFEVDRGVRLASHPELAAPWAMPKTELQELVRFCRAQGLNVGLEFNTPGHQNETNLLLAHPDLAEDPTITDRPLLCVSHPAARRLVRDIVEELVESCTPDLFFLGADEVQFAGNGASTLGRCERCREHAPAKLFGDWVRWLASSLPEGITPLIFGDMFLRADQFGPGQGGNGSAGDVWRALEDLPRHVEIADWHYFPAAAYPSLDYFAARGFKVWPTVAFHFEGIAAFARYALQRSNQRWLHTTWAVPNQEKLPIESIVWAAFYGCLGATADELPVRRMALDFCRGFW